jgi:hypothetical protein
MTPNAITLLFKEARDTFPPLEGRPTDDKANLVYSADNNLLKNKYYFALSTTPACNSTHLPISHTGIADSSASGFYFLPNASVTNLNPNAPPVGVRVANGRPE